MYSLSQELRLALSTSLACQLMAPAAISGGFSCAAAEVAPAPGNRAGVDAVVVLEEFLRWLSSMELEALTTRFEGNSGVVDESGNMTLSSLALLSSLL